MKLLTVSTGALWLVCGALGVLAALVILAPVNATQPIDVAATGEKA